MKVSNLVFLITATLLLAIPASYESHHFAKALLAGALLQSAAYSLILLVLTFRSVPLKRIVFTILFILFGVESFLYFRFDSRLDPNMLTLMLQTTAHETREFASVYLSSPSTFFFIFLFLVSYLGIYRFLGNNAPVKAIQTGWPLKIMAVCIVLLGLSMPFLPLPFPLGNNTINQLHSSVSFVKDRHDELYCMADAINEIVISHSPAEGKAPVIVLIIGESFNKQHSSLYGYGLPTSPFLEKERSRDRLICYKHAVSPTNGTDFAMRFLFTLLGCEQPDSADVSQFVLMPAVFKKAGYRVAYFDNQYTRLSGGSLDYSCGYFLNPNFINDHCFDFRNRETFQYDGDFIDHYRKSFLTKPKSLNIIHLMGQHFDAALRYPSTFGCFTQSDILRDDLSQSQRQQVAEYDNATLYNDLVIKNIIDTFSSQKAIIIYLSDHGEQIYDKPSCYFGRGFGSSHDSETFKAVYEVPFMVWCSDLFIRHNGEVYRRLKKAIHHNICTADLPYLLFDIADIDFNYNNPSRSFIDSTFVPHAIQF